MGEREYIAIGEITVEPIPFLEINELEIEKQINDHTRFYAKGKIDEENRARLLDLCSFGCEAVVKRADGSVLFRGPFTELLTEEMGEVFSVTVRAVSHTLYMDRQKKTRPFHNIGRTIEERIQNITGETAGARTIVESVCKAAAGQFMMQYGETDWEFIKRSASHCGCCLFPDSGCDYPAFYVGKPGLDRGVEIRDTLPCTIRRREPESGRQTSDGADLTYVVKANDLWLKLGEYVRFKGVGFYVRSVKAVLSQSILNNYYELCTWAGIRTDVRYNPLIAGRAVSGVVRQIERDLVAVRIGTADGNGDGDACWFLYSTVYASPDGSGWYCMPEIGDKVRVQFPDEDEGNAYAVSAVSGYQPKQNESDRMSDYTRRYIRNSQGMEVIWTPDRVSITANGASLLDIHQNGTLSLSANANVRIHADRDVTIEAGNQINISGGSGIHIGCGAKAQITMDETGIIELKGKEVYTN